MTNQKVNLISVLYFVQLPLHNYCTSFPREPFSRGIRGNATQLLEWFIISAESGTTVTPGRTFFFSAAASSNLL